MDEASNVLGIKIIYDRKVRKICLDQENYMNEILKTFQMEVVK